MIYYLDTSYCFLVFSDIELVSRVPNRGLCVSQQPLSDDLRRVLPRRQTTVLVDLVGTVHFGPNRLVLMLGLKDQGH